MSEKKRPVSVRHYPKEPSELQPILSPMLTQREATKFLRISLETLAKLRREGLPYVKIGKKVLFHQKDLENFLESRKIVETTHKPQKPRK